MNAMSFMKALGDIPEDLVRCYFDEPSAAANANTSVPPDPPKSYSPVSEPVAANPLKPITKSDSEPKPETPARPMQLPLPVSLVAVAACLAFAVGWGVLISRLKPNPITTPNDSDEMIFTQDESSLALITDNSDSQSSGSDSSQQNASSTVTTSITSSKASDKHTDQTETTSSETSMDDSNEQSGTILPEPGTVPNNTTAPETESSSSSRTTATQTESTAASEEPTTTRRQDPVSLVGEDIIRRYILGEWSNIDCSNWEAENPNYVSQPYYQALSDAEKTEIQQKLSLLEARPNIGYAMKLRQRIMGMDSGSRMTVEELKEYLSTHTVTDDAAEFDLYSLITRTNRYPDVDFGSGRSFAYYFLDESGRCAIYSVTDEAPQFVYYAAESGEFASVPLRDALPIILNL